MDTGQSEIIALAADLLFASRIRAVAEAAGRTVTLVRTADATLDALEAGSIRLVLLDLETRGLDATSLIGRIRSHASAPRIIAFGRHTSTDALAAAHAAGADRVLARSAFVNELPGLVASG